MAGQWVDDPSWGQALSGLFSGGSHAGDIQIKAMQYRKLQQEVRDREAENAALNASLGQIPERYAAMPAPPTNLPVADLQLGKFDAEGNPLTPATGGSTNATLNAPRDWGLEPLAWANRDQSMRDEALATRMSKTPAQLFQTRGLGQVTSMGAPTDPAEFNRVQTQLKGEMPDPNKVAAIHNYSYTDPNSGETSEGSTLNGYTDMRTGKPLPAGATVFSGQPHQQANAFGDEHAAQAAYAQLARQHADGHPLSISDIQRAIILRERAYPETGEFVDMGGRKVWQNTRKTPIPD